jgi:hypothetical protein
MHRILMRGAALALASAAVACGRTRGTHAKTPAAPTPAIAITQHLTGRVVVADCGAAEFGAISNHGVTVRDEHDTIIGTARTAPATADAPGCYAPFTLDLPKAEVYQVAVGTYGAVRYSYAELAA